MKGTSHLRSIGKERWQGMGFLFVVCGEKGGGVDTWLFLEGGGEGGVVICGVEELVHA